MTKIANFAPSAMPLLPGAIELLKVMGSPQRAQPVALAPTPEVVAAFNEVVTAVTQTGGLTNACGGRLAALTIGQRAYLSTLLEQHGISVPEPVMVAAIESAGRTTDAAIVQDGKTTRLLGTVVVAVLGGLAYLHMANEHDQRMEALRYANRSWWERAFG